jgi:hypothetical protein
MKSVALLTTFFVVFASTMLTMEAARADGRGHPRHPDAGRCISGKFVYHTRNCKENGGRW